METRARRFRPSLTVTINLLIALTLAAGIGAIITFFTISIATIRDESSKMNLEQQTSILYTSIENLMIPGEAPIAVKFFSELSFLAKDYQISLYRADGTPAFSDDATLNRVNGIVGFEKFKPHGPAARKPGIEGSIYLEKALAIPLTQTLIQEEIAGKTFSRVVRPLLNLPKCTACHGSDHTIRGVIDLQNDITKTIEAQTTTIQVSAALFFANVLLLALILSRFLGRVVLKPLQSIREICLRVASGDFSDTILLKGHNEVAELAGTVNTMVVGLRERSELTKYISTTALLALHTDQAGKKVFKTIFFSDIRGFTSHTENHTPDEVVTVLNRILDAQSEIIGDEGGDIDKFVGDAVLAIFSGDGAEKRSIQAAQRIQALFSAQKDPSLGGLEVGIGIATGEIIQGMIGSHRRADFTVIGDSVNIASRLCSAAKKGQVIICDVTKRKMVETPKLLGPYRIKLKGKTDYQRVWIVDQEGTAP